MKKIYIVYTVGTIGMKKVGHNYQSVAGYLQAQMDAIPAFQHPTVPACTTHEYEPLLDSSDMPPPTGATSPKTLATITKSMMALSCCMTRTR